GGAAFEEIEIAALVGLADVLLEHGAVAALVAWRQRLPFGTATGKLLIGNMEVKPSARNVYLDVITSFDKCQRSADEALRRNMEDAGTVARARHACIGSAEHVAHTRLHQLSRDWQHAPFGHARAPLRPSILQDEHVVRRDLQILSLDLCCHVVVVAED